MAAHYILLKVAGNVAGRQSDVFVAAVLIQDKGPLHHYNLAFPI
jgi:hypothetical protein